MQGKSLVLDKQPRKTGTTNIERLALFGKKLKNNIEFGVESEKVYKIFKNLTTTKS